MAAKPDTPTKKTIALTEGESKLFMSIMKNLEGDIAFNADAVAVDCGYKSGKVAKDRWSQIKKNKLGIIAAAASPAKKAAAGKKRKGDEATTEDRARDAVEGDRVDTPTKRARKWKAKNEEPDAMKEEEGDEVSAKAGESEGGAIKEEEEMADGQE